jgi:hypothetical protein
MSYSVLKTESVQKLKRSLLEKPELLEMNFDELCDDLHLSMISTTYKVDSGVSLILPKGISQELNGDTENCQLILKALPGLTPAQATDERLWVTLCFSQFKEYVNQRWPFKVSAEEKIQNHIESHWFANGIRGRMRNNGVSRLWWMGYVAGNIDDFPMEKVFDILFFNSDYRQSLLDRNSTAKAANVATAILKITDEAYTAGIEFKRQPFRSFMEKVNMLGGRSNLASMDVNTLVKVLNPVYKEAYAVKTK